MQLATATVTERVTCPRCKGAGAGPWRADYGRCWTCGGRGTVPAAWSGKNIEISGYVARPYAIKNGTATVAEILLVLETVAQEYRLTVITRNIDGATVTWTTTDKDKAGVAFRRAHEVCGRDMSEERIAELVQEFGIS
jgi:hypothetical protein